METSLNSLKKQASQFIIRMQNVADNSKFLGDFAKEDGLDTQATRRQARVLTMVTANNINVLQIALGTSRYFLKGYYEDNRCCKEKENEDVKGCLRWNGVKWNKTWVGETWKEWLWMKLENKELLMVQK